VTPGEHNRTSYSGLECRGLRSKRYLSDGFCQTLRPVSEVLCSGSCVLDDHEALRPSVVSSWGRATGGRAVEWRCVDDEVRHRRVRLYCENGSDRLYRIRVVLSCACQLHQRHRRQMTSSQRHQRRHRRRHRQRAASPWRQRHVTLGWRSVEATNREAMGAAPQWGPRWKWCTPIVKLFIVAAVSQNFFHLGNCVAFLTRGKFPSYVACMQRFDGRRRNGDFCDVKMFVSWTINYAGRAW